MQHDVHTNSDTYLNISKNIFYDKVIAKNNPYFNKQEQDYFTTNYEKVDLFKMNQFA